MSHLYDFNVNLNNNTELKLSSLEGKKVLIVNTASKCGFTKQYDEFEKLYQKNKINLEIIAFPCNQFGGQEPGDNKKIAEFCSLNFNISFPISSDEAITTAAINAPANNFDIPNTEKYAATPATTNAVTNNKNLKNLFLITLFDQAPV